MRLISLLAATSIAATVVAHAQSKPADPTTQASFPATDRGRLAKQWLTSYQSGDQAVYRQFMDTNAESGGTPVDARVERFKQMRQNLGDFTVVTATETAEGIELKVKTATGDEGTVTIMITATAPFRFQAVRVEI